jgi:hypothetical protein
MGEMTSATVGARTSGVKSHAHSGLEACKQHRLPELSLTVREVASIPPLAPLWHVVVLAEASLDGSWCSPRCPVHLWSEMAMGSPKF